MIAATSDTAFVRLAESQRPRIVFMFNGREIEALEGDTVLTALRLAGYWLRMSEFGDGPRAGFCLMGACHDCWMWEAGGSGLRACATPVRPGMNLVMQPQD